LKHYPEQVADGQFGLLRHIHLALVQPLRQVIGRQADEFHLIGLLPDGI